MRSTFLVSTALLFFSVSPARAAPLEECGLEDPQIALSAPVVPTKARESRAAASPALSRQRVGSLRSSHRAGALAGKTVYLSPGHGFTYVGGNWETQRPNTHNLVEDFVSSETISYLLVRYLQNMGAYVVPLRETDVNVNQSIVDDADDALSVEGALELAAGPMGYGHFSEPITSDGMNPFAQGGSSIFQAGSEQSGVALWTFDVAESGNYNVYVGYVQDPSRASDAHYIVRHAGGESHYRVDQRRHGGTWVLLGRFYFEAGRSSERGALALANDSASPGATLSVDVARIGGGRGIFDRGGGASSRPMFEHCARYYAQFNGAPTSVYAATSTDRSDDPGTRSRFAAWDHADGEDAVYVAWHTNALNGSVRGTLSFAYSPLEFGEVSDFTGVPGSLELMDALHTELVGDLRLGWDPSWRDGGQRTAYFAEVNPNHNPEMPAVLLEVAFHDNVADADGLRDPRFRNIAARAIAQGIARYFATRDGLSVDLPPDPPTSPMLVQAGDGALRISWQPPAADAAGGDDATAYRVYLSSDGLAFDDGVDVDGTELVIEGEGRPTYARITATNGAGESMPSVIVGGRVAPSGQARVLVVNGFDRLDRDMLVPDDLSTYGLGTIDRGFLDRINDGSYTSRYGAALAASQVSFDSATSRAIADGRLGLEAYSLVIWYAGLETSSSSLLADAERAALAGYASAGGRLMMTGANLAQALGEAGSAEDAAFLDGVLRTGFQADDALTSDVLGSGRFAGLGALSTADNGPGGYTVSSPDVLVPASGGVEAFAYGGGGSAGVWFEEGGEGRVLALGFPFETIVGAERRAELMALILEGFAIEPDPGSGGGCGCRLAARSGPGPSGFAALAGFCVALWLARRRRRLADSSS